MTIVGYLFALPQQFYYSASAPVKDSQEAPASQAAQQLPAATDPPAARPVWRESGATCLTCGIGVACPGFSSPQEQREHFKTDWHRYNVKRRLAKQPVVSEEQFERVIEQGTEVSISGSESDSSEDFDEGAEEAGGEAPQRQLGTLDPGRRRKGQNLAAAAIPQVTFQAADGSLFAVWRCLLRQDHVKAAPGQPSTPNELLEELRRLRTACGSWMVVLLRGGHFAATVFKARETHAANSAKPDPEGLEGFEVTAHKTFHRYVVRAKAGGKQSSKDATGKFARSAGSRLRRYNEAALERDVQELLSSWSAHVASADLIFVQAPASNARSLFSEGQTTLLQSNPRLRRVPFVTHRPTFSETKRVLRLLTAVFRPEGAEELLASQRRLTEAEEAAAAAAAAEALAAGQLGPAAATTAGSKAQPVEADGGDASAAASTSGISANGDAVEQVGAAAVAAAPAATSVEGPLHRAAKAADVQRVRRLLDSGHDPSARDGKGRTPYALAADKETRDVFRRFMAQNPDRWDYVAAGIPSPLTEEMEAAQAAKKAAHKAKLKAKDAERKAAKAGEGGGGGGGAAEERRRAAATEAEAVRKQAVEDEIAQAAAEAAAIAARLNASSIKAAAPGRAAGGGGGSSSKANTRGGSGSGGRTRAPGGLLAAGADGVGGCEGDVGGAGGWVRRFWPVLALGTLFALTTLAERRRR